jgi:hypothetical protein
MKKQQPLNNQLPKNHVVAPVHAYSDDSFVRMMSAMVGLDPKPRDGKKK